MFFVIFIALLGVLLHIFCFAGAVSRKGRLPRYLTASLFLAALCLRLLAAALSRGFGSDTACFASWAERMFETGPSGFYSPHVFTDYPPGYMYLLWLLGAVRNLFHLEYYSVPHLVLLKLPSILCDILCGRLLFREASRRLSEEQALFLSMAYLFNPAVLLNSSVWGQVDSLFTLAVISMCLYLIRGHLPCAYTAFGIGLLIKPQMLLFSPVLLAGILDQVFLKDFSLRNFFHQLSLGLTAAAGTLILCLPFGLDNVWNQYTTTLSSYPYAAVNAGNLWGLLGLNWISQDNTFLGIPYRVYGGAAIAAAVFLTLLLSLRCRKSRTKYPFLGALLILTLFLFSVRMHERYLYPGLLLLLFAYVYRPDGLCFLCYGGFSLMHFLNTADVLFFYDPADYNRKSPFILAVSAGMLLCGALLYYTAFCCYASGSRSRQVTGLSRQPASAFFLGHITRSPFGPRAEASVSPGSRPRASRRSLPLKLRDILIMLTLTLAYGGFALHDLGDRQAPSTSLDMVQNQSVELDFGENVPAGFWYYIAPREQRHFTLEGQSSFSEDWLYLKEITLENVFTWQNVTLEGGMSRLRFTLTDPQASLLEWVFFDGEGNLLIPDYSSSQGNLFDETDLYPRGSFEAAAYSPLGTLVIKAQDSPETESTDTDTDTDTDTWTLYYPEAGSFRNSMYFDEIYHGRTAYEYLKGLTSYENTHPPLGKILISLGIALFGMNPFGWRIIGTLLGIVMVPVVYLFARRLSGHTSLAFLGCLLFAFDFMHFTQTRIATIDVYITFFVILMYYFMYQYCCLSFYDTSLKRTWLPLGACGICMGLGIASKWTGIYAGAGLAVIFFSVLYRRYREYVYARKYPDQSTGNISHEYIIRSFAPYTRRTILFCLVFFVLIPAVIYLLSYIPFRDYSDRGLIAGMLYNQNTMFGYHSRLEATHDFSSPWYEWPIILRPIWFYSHMVTQTVQGGLREGISSFGNPAVWWAGLPAALYMLCLWIRKKDRTAAFLTIGYLVQYLPWFFVTRITFIYHYFPSVVFVVLMITYSFAKWREHAAGRLSRTAFYTTISLYSIAVLGLFLLFYPVLSGQPVEYAFADKYLQWFKTWVLLAR